MDYLKRQKKLKLIYNIGCFLMGILSDFLFFYFSIELDNLINTFEDASLHVMYIPILFSLLIIYLECRFVSESVKPDGIFVLGSLFGLIHIFSETFKIPNYNNFYVEEYIVFNLIRYFTPVVFFVFGNIISYLVRRLIYLYKCAMAENYYRVHNYIQTQKNDVIEELTGPDENGNKPQDVFDISHKCIGKLSDIIGKSIDPDYKREDKNK